MRMPTFLYEYCTRPEQSKTLGPAPPYTYRLPFWAAATRKAAFAMAAERAALTRGAADAGVAAIPATGSAGTAASRAKSTPRRTSERRPVAVRVIGDLPAYEVSCRVRAACPAARLRLHPESGRGCSGR